MRLMHDMKSRIIVGNCRSEKFSSWLCSDSTALNCYVRGSNHGIQNRLPKVAIVQR